MRLHLVSFLSLLFCGVLNAPLLAQGVAANDDEQPAEQAPDEHQHVVPEFQRYDFETAGFNFGFEVPYEPVIRETTNSSIYAVTVQRRAADGLAAGTDGKMAFVRLTQTIDPVDEIGTIDQLLEATVSDAFRAIENAYGEVTQEVTTDCVLEILGEARDGKRINIGLLPNGTLAYVECYAFELEDGRGVGLTLKLHDPEGDEVPRDLIMADEILSSLEINTINPDTPYYYPVAGFPVSLPVRSDIRDVKRVNQYVVELNVAYELGSGRIQVIAVPEGYSPERALQEQLDGYGSMLAQQSSQGQLSVLWDADSQIPGGESGDGLVSGRIFGIRTGDGDFYSGIYAATDRRYLAVANFTGNADYASELAGYARGFFDRPMSSLNVDSYPAYFDGIVAQLPQGASFVANPGMGDVHEYIVDPAKVDGWDGHVRSAILEQDGYTRVLVFTPDEGMDFETAHLTLCERERDRLQPDGEETGTTDIDSIVEEAQLRDGRAVSMIRSSFVPSVSADVLQEQGLEKAHAMQITSYLVPLEGRDDPLMVSTVSSEKTHPDRDLLTRELIGRFSMNVDGNRIGMRFGSIDVLPGEMYGYKQSTQGLAEHARVAWGDDTMEIKVHPSDPGVETLSNRLLADRYLKQEWTSESFKGEQGLYPENSEGLEKIEIASETGMMFEHALTPKLGLAEGMRSEPVHQRVIGFVSGNSYVTVTIKQHGEQDTERLERLMSLIHNK